MELKIFPTCSFDCSICLDQMTYHVTRLRGKNKRWYSYQFILEEFLNRQLNNHISEQNQLLKQVKIQSVIFMCVYLLTENLT